MDFGMCLDFALTAHTVRLRATQVAIEESMGCLWKR